MAYTDTKRRPSAASMAAVVAIHGAVGAALILGLTISGTIVLKDPPPSTFDLPKAIPTPPPPPTVDQPQTDVVPKRDVVVPKPPVDFTTEGPQIDVSDTIPLPLPPVPIPGAGEGTKLVLPTPKPTPSFAAEGARPRNDPARWVSTEDYRGNWIRRELTGRASFKLAITAEGRVSSCTITASSGHSELDAATCALVSKRARFQPARDGGGSAVAGSYSNTIVWRLPD